MNVFFRVVCSVAGAGAIFAAIGFGLVNDPSLGPNSMAREGQRRCELDRALSHIHQRFLVMEDLVEELVAGKRSLAEAVRKSRGLHKNDDVAMQHIRRAFGGDGDDVAFGRHLLVRVAASLRNSPRQYREVLPRLEAEFKQLYPLTNLPVADRNPLPMVPCREGCAGPSPHDPVDPGL
jgi:hypothetical protein